MSQWEAILRLPDVFQEHVHALYNQDLLPVEVRQFLAPWIESQDWKLAARDHSLACVLFQNLFEHLDIQYSRFTEAHEVVQAFTIRNFKLKIQHEYQENPQLLAEMIRDLLQKEKQILLESLETQSQSGQQVQLPMETEQQYKVEMRVNEAKEKAASLDQEVKFLEEQQEILNFRYQAYTVQLTAHPTDPRLQKKKLELQTHMNELDRKRRDVLDQVKELLGLCETLLNFLQQELSDWLQRQRLSCIGASTNCCLNKLASWVTRTVEVFFQLRRILHELSELSVQLSYEGDPLKTDPPELQARLLEMLQCLLQRSFVVYKQPIMTSYLCKKALVLKTSSEFSVAARFLVDLPELGNKMSVSYTIDKNPPAIKGYRRFNVLGSQDKTLECTQGEGLVVEYKRLKLTEQKAGGGKGSKGANDGSLSIVEELHIITLKTQFNYKGVKLDIEAATLPFVVISNLSWFVRAWASVLWHNLLGSDPKDVTFFSKPPRAPWSLLANALSWQFSCCTKRGLNADQLEMLKKKLCGSEASDKDVTWSKFSKETMPNVAFSFWEWFDAILTLVKANLEKLWNDGYIMGFVSRSTVNALLKTRMPGTFLLRFSESTREGGITCSWVDYEYDANYSVRSVEPFTKKDLASIPLTEIIRNYQLVADENIPENPLKYLYPDIPKDEAFGQYYEKRSEVTMEYQKYMKRKLIVVSKRNVDDTQSSVASGTPQYISDASPYVQELPVDDQTEYRLNIPDWDDIIDQLPMDNVLIDPDCDPMLPNQRTIPNEMSLESFDSLH
ncbi:hypothetical protein GDO78_014669 [Eleutherodactylus coqui]|uniref:Signal transducer and activator of transcription n=1 Tax=Eleutherodactylus coqui TaxID=57060 RepID=A0A8J6EEB1_ELECQ|nr:hypothetical protein GDO78_014669 [Eleutherodactylus coqui]